MTDKELERALYTATLQELLSRIKAGEATAADLSVARAICQNAGVSQVPTATNELGRLGAAITDSLPFPTSGMTPQ